MQNKSGKSETGVNLCPEYRVRLFLSVDLVGSTAYKSKALEHGLKEPHPEWVYRFQKFYLQFPQAVKSAYNEAAQKDAVGCEGPPLVWKTIGDEILFCCRVFSVQHISNCVAAFISALKTYGFALEADGVPLDVKGAGWLAAFPAENTSIALFNGDASSASEEKGYPTEDFELAADKNPHKFDFLGTGIDTGFRIAKNAAADRFTASVGLSYILSKAALEKQFSGCFMYHGREEFKGVNRGQPYPVVSVETDRDEKRRNLHKTERNLIREKDVEPLALRDFLSEFMEYEKIPLPCIPDRFGGWAPNLPSSYTQFEEIWGFTVKEVKHRDDSFAESITINEGNDNAARDAEPPEELNDDMLTLIKGYVSDRAD